MRGQSHTALPCNRHTENPRFGAGSHLGNCVLVMIATHAWGSWRLVKPAQLNRSISFLKQLLLQICSPFKKKGTVRAFYYSKVVKNTGGRAYRKPEFGAAPHTLKPPDFTTVRILHSGVDNYAALHPLQPSKTAERHALWNFALPRVPCASPNAAVASPRPPTSEANLGCE